MKSTSPKWDSGIVDAGGRWLGAHPPESAGWSNARPGASRPLRVPAGCPSGSLDPPTRTQGAAGIGKMGPVWRCRQIPDRAYVGGL